MIDNKGFSIPDDYGLKEIVSRETMDSLIKYHGLLIKWQKAINLVSPSTINSAWQRHFLDSIQVVPLVTATRRERVIVDLGSGAGFPGLVVAMMCSTVEVHMIESDMRKSQFLKTVIRECSLNNAIVHNKNIDDVENIAADVVTARALASLDKLVPWASRFVDFTNNDIKAVFLKGVSWQNEWDGIKSKYKDLKVCAHQSYTDNDAAILTIQKS